jgi:DDE superfamily endonuclease
VLSQFRRDLHQCLTARGDELAELTDAVLCADGPVRNLSGLSLAAVHRRGHGALYDAVNCGGIDIARLRRCLAGLPLPRAADGRLMLAVDVSNWLRRRRARRQGSWRLLAVRHLGARLGQARVGWACLRWNQQWWSRPGWRT